jgi:NAD(P)-dependent dehydrogenase (short-subunit alcohol dehydrogenase family)
MELEHSHAVVTGGARGIGRAIALALAGAGVRAVVVADLDATGAEETAAAIRSGGVAATSLRVDVSIEEEVRALVAAAEVSHGAVDLFVSNAGVMVAGDTDAPREEWQRAWEVNVMAHVYAANAVLPSMLTRGRGYLVSTASAAGLLTNLGAAPYSVTKHAVVALAEWLSVTYGNRGIGVSCLCPQGVRTEMLTAGLEAGERFGAVVAASGRIAEPEEVAAALIDAVRVERFLVLPHPEVAGYLERKATDPEGWLAGMRRLQARLDAAD